MRTSATSGPQYRRLSWAAVLCLLLAHAASAWCQEKPAIPEDATGGSQVFPEGDIPAGKTDEGDIPASATQVSGAGVKPATADYAPVGYEASGPQEGPGAEYLPPVGALPPYYYRMDYYERSGVGARAIADYAPPGYQARDIEEVPGLPEFTPITPPPRLTPEEQAKFVTRGMMPGSFLIPGTSTSFRLRGFVRLAGLYDLDPIGSRDDFVTNTIPVPQTTGQNFNWGARYSRFALETWTPTNFRDWNVHTFIEGDFFNGPAQAVGGGGNPFRLRFAFIDFGYFRVGQQNTVFMDGNAWPSTVDFAGPRGLLNQRRPGFRVTLPLADKLFWAGGIEQPFSDITTNGLGVGVQDVPDFATHLRYEGDLGHVQLSGLARSIGYRPTGGEVTRRSGLGFSASTVFHPWALLIGSNFIRKANPTGLERCRILMQYSAGWGIGRYVQDIAGLGFDGQVDPLNGSFDTPFAVGWHIGYEHWFNERWLTNVTYSPLYAGSTPGQPGSTYSAAKYLAASLWWLPIPRMSLGIEYVWGERENIDSQAGQANRINGLVQYNF
ncbi:MAG: porin [Planctomycetia bacterium]|nr:porin [Planctomycetia bacterium]